MTKDKIIYIVEFYNKILCGTEPQKHALDEMFDITKDCGSALGYCRYMVQEIKKFLDQGKTDKAFRWLGFIQGCLWMMGIFTIDQLKDQNRSSK